MGVTPETGPTICIDDFLRFLRAFRESAEAGAPILSCLNDASAGLSRQIEAVAGEMHKVLIDGESLALVFDKHPNLFPKEIIERFTESDEGFLLSDLLDALISFHSGTRIPLTAVNLPRGNA